METSYQISLNIKTLNGIETYGCFFFGNNQPLAEYTFNLLQGDSNISKQSIISMDLTALQAQLPFPVQIKYCTLEDLATNAKIITKELFKDFNLEVK